MAKLKKQTAEQTFEILLSQKYCKQFHIIDNPTIAFSLAHKSNSSSHSKIDRSLMISDKNSTLVNSKQKSETRKFYQNLKAEAAGFVKSIFNCLQLGKFALSQFFEYEQLVISGFLKSFVEQLKVQCWEKGDFLDFVWTQNTKIMQKIINVFQKSDNNFEISKNLQLKQAHQKYCNFIQSQASKIVEQALETSNLKDIVEILVQKLRVRRKEVKKLFKDTQQLLGVVNQFKDKNVELEIRYLNLIQSNSETNMSELAQIAERKQRLNLMFKQILTIENALYKNSKPFIHEVHLQKPLEAEDFIKEATQIIHALKITNQEVKAQIDIIFDKYQQDFQDTLLKFKRATKKKILLPDFQQEKRSQIKNREVKKVVSFNRSSQTTTTDKFHNNLIKNTEVNVNLNKVVKSCNSEVQTDHLELKSNNFVIVKSTQFDYYSKKQNSYNIKKQIDRSYISSLDLSSKGGSQSSFSSSRSSKASKKRSKKKKSPKQFFQGNIKSRFSLVEGNLKKVRNLNRKSIQMEAIEQQNNEGTKRQIKQNLRSFSAIFMMNDQRQRKSNNMNFNPSLFERKHRSKVQSILTTNSQIKMTMNPIQQKPTESLHGEKPNKKQSRFSKVSKIMQTSSVSSFNQKNLQSKSQPIKNNRQSMIRSSPFSKVHRTVFPNKLSKLMIRQIFTSLKAQNSGQIKAQIEQQSESQEQQQHQSKKLSPQYKKKGYVDLILLKALQAKRPYRSPCVISLQAHSIKSKLATIYSESQAKSKQYDLKSKKFSVYTKHNNLISVISSVFTRAYHRMLQKQQLDNYLEPLYESMTIIYGNMPKQQIYKKIVNFLAQVGNQKNDHICRAFVYMLKIDETDRNCDSIQAQDNYLYMRIVSKLSLNDKPLEDIAKTCTDFNKINQCLPELFAQQSIPSSLAVKIVQIFRNLLITESQAVQPSEIQRQTRKLNLFYCAKIVLQQILQIKSIIKNTFSSYLSRVSKNYSLNSQKVQDGIVDTIIMLVSDNKINSVKNRRRVEGMGWRINDKYWMMDQFATAMLKLQIQNFEDFYVKILNKFNIVNQQSHNELTKYSSKLYNNCQSGSNEQVDEILLLEIAEKQSTLVLQTILGKQFIELFGLTVILLSEI